MGSQVEGAPAEKRRRRGALVSLAFFLGLVLSLLALGTAAAYIGRVFAGWSVFFAVGAAFFSLAAGLVAILGPTIRRHIPDPEITKRGGVAGAFAYGLCFSLATATTSVGPLFLLLTVAAAIGRPSYGALLSLSYAIGRGAPFLLLGLFAGTVGAWLARLDRPRRIAEIISGVALIGLSVYFVRMAQTLL